jgi:membrane protease YdiL (CAAX protease family)
MHRAAEKRCSRNVGFRHSTDSYIVRFRVNPFYNVREERPRAFWRLLFQLAIYAGAVAFSRLVAPSIWIALYRRLVDDGAIERPTSPTSLFVAVQVALVLVALFSLWVSARLLDRRSPSQLGLCVDREWWLDLGFGLFLGSLLMSAIFLIELAAGWVMVRGTFETTREGAPFFPIILAPLVGWVCLGIHEELVFRGYQLTNLAEGLNFSRFYPRGAIVLALVLSSSLFGVFHVWNPNASVLSTINLTLWGGLLLGLGYVLTSRLALPMGLHIAWNFFEGNVFGFPVSGWGTLGATFLSIEQSGPPLFTGVSFGPEARLLTIAASILGASMIVLWVRTCTGRVTLQTSLSEPPTGAANR